MNLNTFSNQQKIRHIFKKYSDRTSSAPVEPKIEQTPNRGDCSFNVDPNTVCQSMLEDPDTNPLYTYFCNLFSDGVEDCRHLVRNVFSHYGVGTSPEWGGSALFWLYDLQRSQAPVDGKIMAFDAVTGRRVKKPSPRITFVSSLESRRNGTNYTTGAKPMFGQHLLSIVPRANIMVVESEKTALAMAIVMTATLGDRANDRYIFLATQSVSGLNDRNLSVITQYLRSNTASKVVLFPDRDAHDVWLEKAKKLKVSHPYQVHVSDLLKSQASVPLNLADNADMADFIAASLSYDSTPRATVHRMADYINLALDV